MKKYLIITICLTIFLTGEVAQYHQNIADWHSKFIKQDITVNLTHPVGNKYGVINCGQSKNVIVGGCAQWLSNGKTYIEVDSFNLESFEHNLIHEIMHVLFTEYSENKTEQRTWNYLKYTYYNS